MHLKISLQNMKNLKTIDSEVEDGLKKLVEVVSLLGLKKLVEVASLLFCSIVTL